MIPTCRKKVALLAAGLALSFPQWNDAEAIGPFNEQFAVENGHWFTMIYHDLPRNTCGDISHIVLFPRLPGRVCRVCWFCFQSFQRSWQTLCWFAGTIDLFPDDFPVESGLKGIDRRDCAQTRKCSNVRSHWSVSDLCFLNMVMGYMYDIYIYL